jgi:hypothetical protein
VKLLLTPIIAAHPLSPQDQVSDLTAQLQREAAAAGEARRAAEASTAEAAAARSGAATEVEAWQAKMAERKKVRAATRRAWVGEA